jgi:transcriptional regulator with XRE-family HTH domain/quercetin dioxygenase-like cupin family protein
VDEGDGGGVTERLADLGARLREERGRHGISQRELARRLGLSASLISQIESGQSKPSVQTLYAIVTELGVSLDHVFRDFGEDGQAGGEPLGDDATVAGGGVTPPVHPNERPVIDLASGVHWERLTTDHEESVDFLFVTYDVGGASGAESMMMRHPGREYGYVISGRLGVQLAFRTYELHAGDSIAFDSTVPHRLWNMGTESVQGIWLVVGRET